MPTINLQEIKSSVPNPTHFLSGLVETWALFSLPGIATGVMDDPAKYCIWSPDSALHLPWRTGGPENPVAHPFWESTDARLADRCHAARASRVPGHGSSLALHRRAAAAYPRVQDMPASVHGSILGHAVPCVSSSPLL